MASTFVVPSQVDDVTPPFTTPALEYLGIAPPDTTTDAAAAPPAPAKPRDAWKVTVKTIMAARAPAHVRARLVSQPRIAPTAALDVVTGAAAGHAARRHECAEELKRYWAAQEALLAQRRLQALKENDADAYLSHLSSLKMASLLQIMEQTHAFMVKIGAQLQRVTGESAAAGDAAARPTETEVSADAQHTDEYRRFKAYVASTKDEYKLVHRKQVFIEHQPDAVQATLMPHQMVGLRFLASLHANGINGILADEMGVGKTLQTLAFLTHLRDTKKARGPQLVLAPLSIVREWQESAATFIPSLRLARIDELGDVRRDALQHDVLLLAIHRVRAFGPALASVAWDFVIVDEAHKAVSNPSTLTAQAIMGVPYKGRLVLTGTPLNSDVQELWSLLNFINPGVFDSRSSFEDVFRRPFASTVAGSEVKLSDEERAVLVLRMHQILRPFMLRRTKQDIDTSLRITFHNIVCPLTWLQRTLLDDLRRDGSIPNFVGSGRDVALRHVITREATAQAVCNHPFNIPFFSQIYLREDDDDSDDDSDDAASESNASECGAAPVRLPSAPRAASPPRTDDDDDAAAAAAGGAPEPDGAIPNSPCAATPACGAATANAQPRKEASRDDASDGAADGDLPPPVVSAEEAEANAFALRSSGKFVVLELMLRRLRAIGRKAVIFSHYLDTVDLVTEMLECSGWHGPGHVALTGATSVEERQRAVLQFRNDPRTLVMVLSIKAGGCGLNLQVADVVIMLDRDYTTTNEDQAIARVFRMGQRNTVRAVYLATPDASEQRVVTIADRKNRPRQAIIEGGAFHDKVGDDDERREILQASTTADVSTIDLTGLMPPPVDDASSTGDAASGTTHWLSRIRRDIDPLLTGGCDERLATLQRCEEGFAPLVTCEADMPEVVRTMLRQARDGPDSDDADGAARRATSVPLEELLPDPPEAFVEKWEAAGMDYDAVVDKYHAQCRQRLQKQEQKLIGACSVGFADACISVALRRGARGRAPLTDGP